MSSNENRRIGHLAKHGYATDLGRNTACLPVVEEADDPNNVLAIPQDLLDQLLTMVARAKNDDATCQTSGCLPSGDLPTKEQTNQEQAE